MWRHLVSIAAAIALTVVVFEFWGEFGTAMTRAVQISADSANDKPMPVTMIGSDAACAKNAPCPDAPNVNPGSNPDANPPASNPNGGP